MQDCFVHPKDLTGSTEIVSLHFWCDDSSNEADKF